MLPTRLLPPLTSLYPATCSRWPLCTAVWPSSQSRFSNWFESRRHLDWLSWLNAEFERGSVARLRSYLKSCLTFTFSR